MTFDDAQRGRGIRNHLAFKPGFRTFLFGFYFLHKETEEDYVVAAYDPQQHREYGYSASLQITMPFIEEAFNNGLAFYKKRRSSEIVVVFRLSAISKYFDYMDRFHQTQANESLLSDEPKTLPLTRIIRKKTPTLPPELSPQERQRMVTEFNRYIRERKFTKGIRQIYERCAICGFQYDDILDAAHIVPVAEGGTDTYDNGLGLCPNCHRMYDKGFILVDGNGQIFINSHHAEEYDQIGRAGSLENLRQTLRQSLWLPEDRQFHPSAENLEQTFIARR